MIRVPEVRVISPDGEQLGVKPTREALELADKHGLDLVEVSPNAKPPVTRIMDLGRYRYELEQKEKKARKHRTTIEVKEIKLRPKIDDGDFNTKKNHVIRFLKHGAKVKVTIMFRGREMAHPDLGRKLLDRLAEDVAEYSEIEFAPKQEGRNMIMILNSTYKEDKEMRDIPKD
ncbi:MAG: translation initiation factor IF-3 [Actinobacteria bacterium]|nr:MAG: translation initiation factor IF-3 [Actinomycetota bacterium]